MISSQKSFYVFYSEKHKNIVFSGERSEPKNLLAFLYRNSKKNHFFPSFPASEASRKIFGFFI